MKKFEIEPIPAEKHTSTEGVYVRNSRWRSGNLLERFRSKRRLAAQLFAAKRELMRMHDPQRLERFQKALEEN